MTESDITRVTTAAGYRMQSFARRDIYCVSGDHCRHVDIVVSGELVARMTGLSGRQVEVISLRCGDIIAPCFIYASDKRLPIDIEAQTDTTILRMQPSALQQMVDADACVRRNFIRCLSDIGSYTSASTPPASDLPTASPYRSSRYCAVSPRWSSKASSRSTAKKSQYSPPNV